VRSEKEGASDVQALRFETEFSIEGIRGEDRELGEETNDLWLDAEDSFEKHRKYSETDTRIKVNVHSTALSTVGIVMFFPFLGR
jgi:hypothetical protein